MLICPLTCYLTYFATFLSRIPVYSLYLHKKSINYFCLGGFPIYGGSSISANIPPTLNASHSFKMCLMLFTINPKNQQMSIPHLVLLPFFVSKTLLHVIDNIKISLAACKWGKRSVFKILVKIFGNKWY